MGRDEAIRRRDLLGDGAVVVTHHMSHQGGSKPPPGRQEHNLAGGRRLADLVPQQGVRELVDGQGLVHALEQHVALVMQQHLLPQQSSVGAHHPAWIVNTSYIVTCGL